MFVCVCRAVTDGEVLEAIDGGACTVAAVTEKCAAGGDCGACHAMIEDMIEERIEAGCAPRAGVRRHLPVLEEERAA